MSGDDILPELDNVFNDYNINLTCCRKTLLANVDFNELSNKIYLAGQPQ